MIAQASYQMGICLANTGVYNFDSIVKFGI